MTNEERQALIERRIQIMIRMREWREENKKLGLEPTISDNWTPQQMTSRNEKRTYDKMISEDPSDQVNEGASTSQAGRGEKRSLNDLDDDDEDDERPYVIENVKEVNIDKFKTKGTNYTVRFTNVMHVSLPSGGKGRKRANIKLEKHLEKRSVVRIQNKDNLRMARTFVVAKAKIDEDPVQEYRCSSRNYANPIRSRTPYKRRRSFRSVRNRRSQTISYVPDRVSINILSKE